MPPPPPPFLPTPLPNIGQSGKRPSGYSTTVKVEGEPVAIQGASFGSSGDVASKATGGGILSSNAEGPTKFLAPGSLNVRIQGKNVQLLSDQMLNNCGPSGTPANSATMAGILQNPVVAAAAAANPENEDHCGAGNHQESVQHPTIPKKEWNPRKRLETMRELAKTPEDMFEVAAAEHNINSGSITHGNQLSRPLTAEEKKAGRHPDDQKVMAVCKVCGYRREIDHAPDRNSTVEAKSTSDAISAGKQKANNAARVAQEKSVTYKSPPLGRQKLQALLDEGFSHITVRP